MPSSLTFIRDILICEDHPFVRIGLEVSLKELLPSLRSIRAAGTAVKALELASAKKPDLAIVDLGLPDRRGTDLIQDLRRLWRQLPVLVVTSCDNPAVLTQVRKMGVAGIAQKSSSPEHFSTVLRSLKEPRLNEAYLDPAVSALLQEHKEIQFTPREFEVLQEIVKGLSNTEIAANLSCSVHAVRFHRANILQKSGIRTGAELTAWFLQGQRQRD